MSNSSVPSISDKERLEALKKATEVRSARAQLRERIKTGELSVKDVIEMDDSAAQGMKVSMLIRTVPGYGTAKCEKIMAELGISDSRHIRGLGDVQRAALIAYFEGK